MPLPRDEFTRRYGPGGDLAVQVEPPDDGTLLGKWARYNFLSTLSGATSMLLDGWTTSAAQYRVLRSLSKLDGSPGRFFASLTEKPDEIRADLERRHEEAKLDFLDASDRMMPKDSFGYGTMATLTMATAAEILDPSDLVPAGAVSKLGGILAAKLPRASARAAKLAGQVVDVADVARVAPLAAKLDEPVGVAEAMAHANVAASPEAMARQAGGTRFYRLSASGEATPIVGVDAVDVRVGRGESKVRVSPDGAVTLEGGTLNPAQQAAVTSRRGLRAGDQASTVAPETVLDLDAPAPDDFLASMGIGYTPPVPKKASGVASTASVAASPIPGIPDLGAGLRSSATASPAGSRGAGTVAEGYSSLSDADRVVVGDGAFDPKRPLRVNRVGGEVRISQVEEGEQLFQFLPQKIGAQTAEDAREVAGIIGDNFGRFMQSRRGRMDLSFMRHPEVLKQLALESGTSVESLIRRQPGEVWNVERTAVLHGATVGVRDRIATVTKSIAEGGDTELARVELARLTKQHAALAAVAAGNSSELGRALRAHQELVASTTMPLPKARAIYKKYAKELSDEQVSALSLATDDAELSSLLNVLERPGLRDYVHEWWMSAILSRPSSHLRNVIGNAFMLNIVEPAVAAVRAPLSGPIARFQGAGTKEAFRVREVSVGLAHGYTHGVSRALEAFSRGVAVTTDANKLQSLRRGAWQNLAERRGGNQMLSAAVDWPLRALAAEDELFKSAAVGFEQSRIAASEAAGKGLRGAEYLKYVEENAQRPDVFERAIEFANAATFTDGMSEMGAAASSLVNSPLPHTNLRPLKYIQPFVHIADRLIVRGIELTPFGFVAAGRHAKQVRKAVKAGKVPINPNLTADLTARATIGSSVLASAVMLGLQGRIVGEAPKDPEERQRFYDEGKQPWSIKVGDKYYPFGRLDPAAMPLSFGAILSDAVRDGVAPEGPAMTAIAIDATMKLAGHLLDKSYLTGLSDFFTAMRSKDPQDSNYTQRFFARQVTGFLPASGLQSTVAQAIDPALRRPETFREYLYEQIPFLRQEVPLKINRWGEEVVPQGGSAKSFLPTGTPLVPTTAQFDHVDAEMKVHEVSVGVVPRMVTLSGGERVRLSSERWEAYARERGQAVREAVTKVVDSKDYWTSSERVRKARLERAKSAAIARVKVRLGIGGEEDQPGPR